MAMASFATALGANEALRRSWRTHCSAAPVQVRASPLTLHLGGETSLSLPISREDASALSTALEGLFKTFSDKSKAKRPQRWESLDFCNTDDETGVKVELFCNPNGFTNAFQAKVLVTISDEKLCCTTEAQLTALKADVKQFLGEQS